jgi:hypothetical protein
MCVCPYIMTVASPPLHRGPHERRGGGRQQTADSRQQRADSREQTECPYIMTVANPPSTAARTSGEAEAV